MQLEEYDLSRTSGNFRYEFYSEGPNGRIRKIIEFQPIAEMGEIFFNLVFGDWMEGAVDVDVLTISNNKDRDKILFTVATAVVDFINFHPAAVVYLIGSTDARTRLYQMNISYFWSEINLQYSIYGRLEEEWLPFQKGVNYEAFLVFKKNE